MEQRTVTFHGCEPIEQARRRALALKSRQLDNAWLLEHAPWLWHKPRLRVLVSMRTGSCSIAGLAYGKA